MELPSDLYDRDYFLSDRCDGWEYFARGHGLSLVKRMEVDLLSIEPGMSVLDAGCGRGEVLLACARRGARVAGIDYSDAAIEITRKTLSEVDDADVRQGQVTRLPWAGESFDRVLSGDVLEHLTPGQMGAALAECLRVVRPGGRLVVHTAPNRLFRRLAWPIVRPAMRLLGAAEAAARLDAFLADLRAYHVNEQSVFSLRRALRRAGFDQVSAWVDSNLLRSGAHQLTRGLEERGAVAFAARVAGIWPLRLVLGNDLYAIGTRARP